MLLAGGFVIVAPERFHEALAEVVAARSRQMPTELASLEKILTGEGADDPEKLKRWLFDKKALLAHAGMSREDAIYLRECVRSRLEASGWLLEYLA